MVLCFLWNATRDHRLTPGRSETDSGSKAYTDGFSHFWCFPRKEPVQLIRSLSWTRNYGTRSRQPQ